MSDPFTTIDNDTVWYDVDLANEIIDAINERSMVSGAFYPGVQLDNVVADDDVSYDLSWIQDVQDLAEDIIPYFLDHTAIPDAGDLHGEDTIPAFDAAGFATASGLGTGLWRRATAWDPGAGDDWTNRNDGMYLSQGQASEADVYGPWNLVDMHAALSTLKWTWKAIEYSQEYEAGNRQIRNPGGSWESTCAATVSAWETTQWPGSSWEDSYGAYYQVQAGLVHHPLWLATGVRRKSLARITGLWAARPCTPDIYYKIIGQPGMDFLDMDGLGVDENDYCFHETIGSAQAAIRTADTWFGAIDTDPFSLSGLSCPDEGDKNAQSHETLWVLKWDFTTSD